MKTLEDVKVGDTVWWHDVVNGRGLVAATVTMVGDKCGYEYIIADLEAHNLLGECQQ